jgi:hypothetical protein
VTFQKIRIARATLDLSLTRRVNSQQGIWSVRFHGQNSHYVQGFIEVRVTMRVSFR